MSKRKGKGKGKKTYPVPVTKDMFGGTSNKGKWEGKPMLKCWKENHKPISIGGGTFFGGACQHPQPGYDVYIGLDYSMAYTKPHYPWLQEDSDVVEFQFKITDMSVPTDVKNFKSMIQFIGEQLAEKKKVQVGCIGGHGRTGLVLAALVAHLGITKDAIQWARKHHCKKAVESEKQVAFLMEHFGASKAKPAKAPYKPAKSTPSNWGGKDWKSSSSTSIETADAYSTEVHIGHIVSPSSIW